MPALKSDKQLEAEFAEEYSQLSDEEKADAAKEFKIKLEMLSKKVYIKEKIDDVRQK